MTGKMQKFVCQYNFSIALEKINLKKSPWPPTYTYMCLVSQGSTSQFFLFFLQVRMQRFYTKALCLLILLFISRTDLKSNCCVTKTAHA